MQTTKLRVAVQTQIATKIDTGEIEEEDWIEYMKTAVDRMKAAKIP